MYRRVRLLSIPYLQFLKGIGILGRCIHRTGQNHFYAAEQTETATPGYTLFNFSLGSDIIVRGRKAASLFVEVNNLTNKAYQNHLSRLKYAAINPVTGRQGVFNMGRNMIVKLQIPIM